MTSIARRVALCLSPSLRQTCGTAVVLAGLAGCSSAAESLPEATSERAALALALDIDATGTSASGLSSGAFMAVQFHVAFAASMSGVAVFAGGPFRCAQGSALAAVTTCMSSASKLEAAPFIAATKSAAARGAIDDPARLKGQRVFLFGGADDTTVNPAVMDGLRDYYAAFVSGADLAFERRRAGTAHTMPTESYGGGCATSASPYLGSCGYDGAGAALAHLHGPLAPRAAALSGTFVTLAQGAFVAAPASHSLADTAVAYVPASCAAGERCRVHVAFHGCKQSTSAVGDAFYKHAGYNEWADTNHLVVLYPQTIATQGTNPNGCWDWWGYDSAEYATRSGPQMRMVKALVDALASGITPGPASAASAGGGGATGSAGAGGGAPSAPSATAGGDAAPACVLASNADHIAAGRATEVWGFAFAAGSNQGLGLASPFVWSSLRRAGAGLYVLGLCP
jgi:poly(3-hydroxybutyrate) depolymerase